MLKFYGEASRNHELIVYIIIAPFLPLLQVPSTLNSASKFGTDIDIFVIFNSLKPSGNYMYTSLIIINSAFFPAVYLWVLCDSQKKQQLFPKTALTN
jgi:hypothetical protein